MCISRSVMASIFIAVRGTVAPAFCSAAVSAAEFRRYSTSPFRRIRPLLVPASQQELAVAFGVALVAEYSESARERAQKLFAIALLHLLRFAAGFGRSLPVIDLRRYFDARLTDEGRIFCRGQERFDSFRL